MLTALQEVRQQLLAFGITDFLQDDLLGSLRTNPAKLDRYHRLFDHHTPFQRLLAFLCLAQGNFTTQRFKQFVPYDRPAAE